MGFDVNHFKSSSVSFTYLLALQRKNDCFDYLKDPSIFRKVHGKAAY